MMVNELRDGSPEAAPEATGAQAGRLVSGRSAVTGDLSRILQLIQPQQTQLCQSFSICLDPPALRCYRGRQMASEELSYLPNAEVETDVSTISLSAPSLVPCVLKLFFHTISGVLPGESQGRRSLVGCRLWGCTELDTTDAT